MYYSPNKNLKGFTMIELMISIAIIGTLASIAVPAYNGYVLKVRTSEATSNLASLFHGEAAWHSRRNEEAKTQGVDGLVGGVAGERGYHESGYGNGLVCAYPLESTSGWQIRHATDNYTIQFKYGEPGAEKVSGSATPGCADLGWSADGPVYFYYAASTTPGAGTPGQPYWQNRAIQDIDGDGLLGGLTESIYENNNGDLYRGSRCEYGDQKSFSKMGFFASRRASSWNDCKSY